jgi:hypothetical protein
MHTGVLVGKPEKKKLLRRNRQTWKDNNKIDFMCSISCIKASSIKKPTNARAIKDP